MRAAPVIIATAVAAVTAVGVGVAVASDRDDTRQVEAISVGAVTVDDSLTAELSTTPTDAGTPSTGATTDDTATATADSTPSATDTATGSYGSQQVQGLDQIQGVLTRDDDDDHRDDRDDFEAADVDLELGPDSWLLSAGPIADFDGDGTLSPVIEELETLIGQEVTVLGRMDDDGDDLEVYEIQGLTFRDSAGGPAPWRSGDDADALGRNQIAEAALAAVGEGSRLDSVDREDDNGSSWEVEVVDAQGREQRVLLDAAGAVLDIRLDD